MSIETLKSMMPFAINVEDESVDTQEEIYRCLSSLSGAHPNDDSACYCGDFEFLGMREGSIYFGVDISDYYSHDKEAQTLTSQEFMRIFNAKDKTATVGQQVSQNNVSPAMTEILRQLSDTTVYHFRATGKDGKPSATGGKTVVFHKLPDGVLLMGVSVCSPKDNFNRKIGVQLAKERFEIIWTLKGAEEIPAKHKVDTFIRNSVTIPQKDLWNRS